MTAKVLSITVALGLLIGSTTIGLAQNSSTDKASVQKMPEKALMDPKAGMADVPGNLTQETATGGAAFAPALGTTGSADTTGAGEHQ